MLQLSGGAGRPIAPRAVECPCAEASGLVLWKPSSTSSPLRSSPSTTCSAARVTRRKRSKSTSAFSARIIRIEDKYDSDNSLRVRLEKPELGPYDVPQDPPRSEMLTGHTAGADEAATIALFGGGAHRRDGSRSSRALAATASWEHLAENRRIIDAITLAAADAAARPG